MEIVVLRYSSQKDDTLGLVFVDGKFQCYSLEDEKRDVKVKGETRIPDGEYILGVQDLDTPLTLKYRAKYSWFKKHLHVKNVPGFSGIYIHIGNTDENTDGCLLLGNFVNNNNVEPGKLTNSTAAFKDFYEKVYSEAEKGNVIIKYVDYA